MKYLFFFTFSFFYVSGLLAQVPVGQDQAIEEQNAVSIPLEEDSLSAIFSDPSEIEMIEGLDEPLERVKLRDQDSNMILDMVQAITGRYILRPQNLPQVKINFDSMNVLTKRETLLALESLLAMNGVGITKIDSQFYKAVPATGINAHVPIWIDVPASSLPPSQRIYTKMFHLEYVPAEKMREILNPFATPNVSSLIIFPVSNSILITDSLVNLQRIEKLIDQVDNAKRESTIVVATYNPINHSPSSLVEKLGKSAQWQSFASKEFHVEPAFAWWDAGGTVTVTCHKLDKEKILSLLREWDYPSNVEYKSKLVPLYHADASNVATMLEKFLSGSIKTKENLSKPGSPPKEVPTSNVSSTNEFDVLFSQWAAVEADLRSNGVFLSGTSKDVEKLTKMSEILDSPLPMARIDTIFLQVDLSQANQRGIDALFQDVSWSRGGGSQETVIDVGADGKLGGGDDQERVLNTLVDDKLEGTLKVPLLNSAVSLDMDSWKINSFQWNQIFGLASQRNDVRIFSTPSLTISHGGAGGEEGAKGGSMISISDSRSIGLPSVNYGNNQMSESGLKDKTATTQLKIENPRIRKTVRDKNGNVLERGTVFMSVTVKTQKFDTTNVNTYEGQTLPSVKSREANTDLAIRDGQIMMLGGFKEVQMDSSTSKYNLLSEIPYLGEKFFTPNQTKYTPTELLIFIRPTIIDPENPSDEFSLQNTNAIDGLMEPNYTPTFKSPSGKILGVPGKPDKASNPDKPSAQPSL